jgi:predicted secreted hydrolase
VHRRLLGNLLLCLAAALLVGGSYALTRPERPAQVQARVSVANELGGEATAGFARALAPRPFSFPADHGPHPEYRTEWWYYTGNLETAQGRHFGFQLTMFRIGLAPEPVERASAWGTTQLYMAHLALSDVRGNRFYAFERFSRAALGLAGAQAQPFRVWLEDWSAEATRDEALPMRLRAAQGEVAIDLSLQSAKPAVLQGTAGLSQKGSTPGNASYYYSLTRLSTSGTIRIAAEAFDVRGLSWMDREWSTAALEEEQVGWDWFALQLADGREVMFYQLRHRDGSASPFSSGTLIRADGSTRGLTPDEVHVEVLDRWQSPRDGARYPSRWRLRIPAERLDLEVTPYLADQQLDVAVRYWEGAVQVRGTSDTQPISGNGYVELVGYGDTPGTRR